MEHNEIFRMLAALCFVVALMGGLSLVVKKFGLTGLPNKTPKQRRLKIIESLNIDGRRRLVLLQRDETQHLVILGGTSETVIETHITPVAPHETPLP